MKSKYPIACLALLALAAGCTNTRWGFLNRDHSNERPVQGAPPPKDSVVAYLNENASRIQSMRCDDLHITLHQGLVPIGLSGKMMTEATWSVCPGGGRLVLPPVTISRE